MESKELQEKIKTQIEYYLSDENLKNDAFFHDHISASEGGWLPIELFQNCNKVKRLEIKNEQISAAVKHSKVLELSEDQLKVRRKDNKSLPVLRKDKIYITLNRTSPIGGEPNVELFVPLVYSFKTTSEMFFRARDLERKIRKRLAFDVPYLRVSKKAGCLVVNELTADIEALNQLASSEIKIDSFTINLEKMSEDETERWLKTNIGQLQSTLKTKYNKSMVKDKKESKFEINEKIGSFEIGGQKFQNIVELNNQIKLIVARTRNEDRLKPQDFELLKALLAHHPRLGADIDKVTGFFVNVNPLYPETRCFFLVREDGSSEDFSFHKCVVAFGRSAQAK